jgi:hypothetical protein
MFRCPRKVEEVRTVGELLATADAMLEQAAKNPGALASRNRAAVAAAHVALAITLHEMDDSE